MTSIRARASSARADLRAAPPILLFTELYPPAVGGSAVLFHEIYRRLPSIPVQVLADERAAADPTGEGRSPVPPVTLLRLATPHRGVASPEALRHHIRNARHILRHAPDARRVVHCARGLPEGLAAFLARLAGGPRYMCWAHGEEIKSALTSREHTLLLRRVYRSAQGVIANSRNTAALVRRLGVERRRVRVVYPGVDPERFRPEVDGSALRARLSAPGDFVLLSVGRLQRRKGHDMTLRAVRLLRERGVPVRYWIAGTGEEEGFLRSLCTECGLEDAVSFLGKVDNVLLPSYYAACDVFVLPNRVYRGDIEGFGIVYLEAAASCRPAVGGRSGGVPEAIEEGVSGLLVSGEDPEELANVLERLYRAPELRERLGRQGRERVLRRFTWERAATRIAALHRRDGAGSDLLV